MSFEKLDDPALVLPRVGDVHGTFSRLGFAGHSAKRVQFYRQFVPLFDGGVPAQFVSRRISHISMVILLDDAQERGRLWIKYGYPERYRKGKKIIEGFKPLISEETYFTVNLHPDRELREFEKSMAHVIECVKTKRIDCDFDVDSETGVVKKTFPPWEAVVMAIQQTFASPRVRMTGDWWIGPEDNEKQPELDLRRVRPVGKYARLPNFDRRRDIRRLVRRPV
jgi:hypothetical protein